MPQMTLKPQDTCGLAWQYWDIWAECSAITQGVRLRRWMDPSRHISHFWYSPHSCMNYFLFDWASVLAGCTQQQAVYVVYTVPHHGVWCLLESVLLFFLRVGDALVHVCLIVWKMLLAIYLFRLRDRLICLQIKILTSLSIELYELFMVIISIN